ncbi:glucose-6-phosphate dehydrogenase-like protein [Mesocricetibacter intestinalis]|uniref:Glucose-6-phosphate dehydrogenase-like protein n=2 Tax=Mesocricetibacter intestinalis TaxID=1521930 RepID=A0A4R6VC57_9PAST|nr:HI_0552 family protein [Mesocricetibacter intestinalis]TDQ58129.1 glucose-6-phosphate dehydrogenase-like protein [Mesocricetibacter intestinalis]
MLTAESCYLFNLPFFQFAQLKKYTPELIPAIKQDYKRHWNEWKQVILQTEEYLDSAFAAPHIERWTNGWQLRAHFFAYFKYSSQQDSAAILSVILNRRRLLMELNWHSYRAESSRISLQQYNRWTDYPALWEEFGDFEIRHCDESEYADFLRLEQLQKGDLVATSARDFWRIGKSIEAEALTRTDVPGFIAETFTKLLPLYHCCHQ